MLKGNKGEQMNDEDLIKKVQDHERRISALENNRVEAAPKGRAPSATENKSWYKKDSTTAKLIGLLNEGFFDTHRTLGDQVKQFATKDYHFKAADLTLPIRQLVRRNMLKREKIGGKWAYIKV